MKVMVGGTFDPLHDGHRELLRRSFAIAGPEGSVTIGLTTDEFAALKYHPVRPYEERRQRLVDFIRGCGYAVAWSVEPLADRYGPAIERDFDVLVVSEGTYPVAEEINRLRREHGRKKVDILQVRCIVAEDGRWISSTRIIRGEIDEHGHLT